MGKLMRKWPLMIALVIAVSTVDFLWAGYRVKTEDSNFRNYVMKNEEKFSPQIIKRIGESTAVAGASLNEAQFLVAPFRNSVYLEYQKAFDDYKTQYDTALMLGGLGATKNKDGSWTVKELRGFGPS